jgi:hypothetical protein
LQQDLEADREVLVLARGGRSLGRRAIREALDQGIDHLLLQPVRGFGTNGRWCATRKGVIEPAYEAASDSV